MNAELVADSVLLADPVQGDPGAGRVADVVVEVVAGRPSGHRALLDAEGQPALFCLLQEWNEMLFEVAEVLVHAVLLIASDKSTDGVRAQKRGGIEDAHHEIPLLFSVGRS